MWRKMHNSLWLYPNSPLVFYVREDCYRENRFVHCFCSFFVDLRSGGGGLPSRSVTLEFYLASGLIV